MRVHIIYPFTDKAFGGANQFLKCLRSRLESQGQYTHFHSEADAIIINASPGGLSVRNILYAYRAKVRQPRTVLVIRVDGLLSRYRPAEGDFDRLVVSLCSTLADGVVFQSAWGRSRLIAWGLNKVPFEATVLNAADPQIYFPRQSAADPRIKLIASSWSGNPLKGAAALFFLDRNLDFSRYQMTFVGRLPVTLHNIRQIPPQPSNELAGILREHQIFISPVEDDTCSNSLIEALSCGLPAVALRSGGNPEILGNAGVLYAGLDNLLNSIDQVAGSIAAYRAAVLAPAIDAVAEQYMELCKTIKERSESGFYSPRRFELGSLLRVLGGIGVAKTKKLLKSKLGFLELRVRRPKAIVFEWNLILRELRGEVEGRSAGEADRYNPLQSNLVLCLRSLKSRSLCFVISDVCQSELYRELERLRVRDIFQEALGAPLARADSLQYLLEAYRLEPGAVTFIGDGRGDAELAERYRIRFVERLQEWKLDRIICSVLRGI